MISRPMRKPKPDGPPKVSALLMSRYDREKLYNEVWTKPLIHLAKDYGVSETTVAKRCKNLRIPIPGMNYWQRKAKNEPVPERQPLEPIVVTEFTRNTQKWDERTKRFDRIRDFAKPRTNSRRHPV
jgi:hypothetical protein